MRPLQAPPRWESVRANLHVLHADDDAIERLSAASPGGTKLAPSLVLSIPNSRGRREEAMDSTEVAE